MYHIVMRKIKQDGSFPVGFPLVPTFIYRPTKFKDSRITFWVSTEPVDFL